MPTLVWLRRLIDAMVQLGGWAFLAAACLVTYDVITRKLFNMSIAGADEISGYIFAVATAASFSFVLISRANIRIDLLYNKVPPVIKRTFDVLSITLTILFFALLTYFAYGLVEDAIRFGSRSVTPLQTPLAIPQTAWLIGLVLALTTAVVLLLASLRALISGKSAEVAKLIGIPSLHEEIANELHQNNAPPPAL